MIFLLIKRSRLTTDKLIAPVYFILGGNGTGEGCVITRTREKSIDLWELGSDMLHPWFILQTNCDHFIPAEVFKDERREVGDYCMQEMGQKVCLY